MNRRDDDLHEMTPTSPALDRFLGELRALGDVPSPPPSPQLEALLSGEPAVARPPGPRRLVRGKVPTTLAAAAAVVTLLVAGAAAHSLPAAAQRLVSRVVNTVTPFHIDPDAPSGHPTPGPTGTRMQPGSRVFPTPASSAPRSGEPSTAATPPGGGPAGSPHPPRAPRSGARTGTSTPATGTPTPSSGTPTPPSGAPTTPPTGGTSEVPSGAPARSPTAESPAALPGAADTSAPAQGARRGHGRDATKSADPNAGHGGAAARWGAPTATAASGSPHPAHPTKGPDRAGTLDVVAQPSAGAPGKRGARPASWPTKHAVR